MDKRFKWLFEIMRPKWGQSLLIIFYLGSMVLPGISGHAQQLIFSNYSYKEGLTTYNIRKLVQDRYGFIWIATQAGLFRFNAEHFDAIQRSGNAPGQLRENFIFDMAYDGKDRLILATFKGGIDEINVRTLQVKEFLPTSKKPSLKLWDLWIYKIRLDPYGDLWIGGRNYLAVYRQKEDSIVELKEVIKPGMSQKINFIKPVNDHVMAIGTADKGMLFYDMKSLKLLAQYKKLAPGINAEEYSVYDILIYSGYAYLAAGGYLLKGKIQNDQWTFIEEVNSTLTENTAIYCLTASSDGRIWLGTNAGLGCFDTEKGQIALYQTSPFRKRWLEDNTINDLMFGNQGLLWIASQKSLQSVNLKPGPFSIYSGEEPGNSKLDHVYSLVPRGDSGVFACGTEGLYSVDFKSHKIRQIPGSAALGINHHILPLGADRWMLSTDKGSYLYDSRRETMSPEKFIQAYPEWLEDQDRYFNTSLMLGNQVFLASEEEEGLFIWDTAAHTVRRFKTKTKGARGLPENHIHNLRQDREGNVWILMDESVAKYDRNRDSITEVLLVGGKGLNSRVIFDMYDDGETLWFGTFSGGLNGYNKKTHKWIYITRQNGLSNDCVYGILPENDSIYWLSTNYGISRMNVRSRNGINYYFDDGLQDNAFDENGCLKIGRRFLLGGMNGFTSINPDESRSANERIPVYINQIEYFSGDTNVVRNELTWKSLTVPPGTNSIRIHLSALCFSGRQKVRFSYRIENLQDQYMDVSDENIIVLNAVAHGDYEIQIRYRNERGVIANDKLILPLHVQPAWYQTWWFKALLLALGFGIGYGFYRLRINQILKQQQIRKDVAADLHDDIGSNLNSVKVFAHLAMTTTDNKEFIRNVEENLEHATVGLRDMIWILDDKLDSIENLADRLNHLAGNPAEAIGISVHFTISDGLQSRKLSKPLKRNLFLIAKEAINNSVKYASCKNIWVTFLLNQKKLVMIIKDDGQGFSPDTISAGYGLNNMKSRAEQIHFECAIHSGSGGTQIRAIEK